MTSIGEPLTSWGSTSCMAAYLAGVRSMCQAASTSCRSPDQRVCRGLAGPRAASTNEQGPTHSATVTTLKTVATTSSQPRPERRGTDTASFCPLHPTCSGNMPNALTGPCRTTPTTSNSQLGRTALPHSLRRRTCRRNRIGDISDLLLQRRGPGVKDARLRRDEPRWSRRVCGNNSEVRGRRTASQLNRRRGRPVQRVAEVSPPSIVGSILMRAARRWAAGAS